MSGRDEGQVDLTGGTAPAVPRRPAPLPTDAAWRRSRSAAQRVLAVLEPLEPAAQRRVLAATAILLGLEQLGCELIHPGLIGRPAHPGG